MTPQNNPRSLLIDDSKEHISADRVARTFEEGMTALLNEGPWDILYIDYNLEDDFVPKRNGLTILQLLKEHPDKIPPKIKPVSADPWYNSMLRDEIVKLMEIRNSKE